MLMNLSIIEDVRPNTAYDLGSVPGIDGRAYQISEGDALAVTITHRLDRVPEWIVPGLIEGDARVWITGITDQVFVVNRSADVPVRLFAT